MMNLLIDKLHTGQSTLVVLHEGGIRQFEGVGVRKLYDLQNNEPELLYESKLAAKTVGRTAAKMMAGCGVSEVYADIISEAACDVLRDAGIKVGWGQKVDHARFIQIWTSLGETV